MKKITRLTTITFITLQAHACETCALYSPIDPQLLTHRKTAPPFKLNWFTRYSELNTRLTGTKEQNSRGEKIESYIHQLSLGYKASPNWSAQISLPILSRDFKFREDDQLRSDDESGVGDLSFLAKHIVHESKTDEGAFRVTLLGGVKTPTGDADRLGGTHDHAPETGETPAEESAHGHAGLVAGAVTEHHEEEAGHVESAISGHDVTLGSGSWDLIGGVRADYNRADWIYEAMLQYYYRTEGDFDYEFADDLYVSAHVGRVLARTDNAAFALRAGVLGEFRDADEQQGVKVHHTELDAWYIDVTATVTRGSFLGEAGVDLPLEQDSGAATLVPDVRFRLSAGLMF